MKKFIYILALVLLILGACGDSEPDYADKVQEGWENLSEEEQEDICTAYSLYGEEFLETTVNEESDLPEAEIGARMNLLRKECS